MSFAQLGLTPDLLRAVARQGYTIPTPVQAESIPLVLAGRDLLAGAQTGTGKTAAFVLPMLQRLAASVPGTPGRRRVRALILAPTRELAIQVESDIRIYSSGNARSMPIYGGAGFQPQVNALRRGPEIVVATPGRLLDHVRQRTIDLGGVEILVLDEADRMLDMGFIRDIRAVIALLPARRQNLLFSATFSREIRGMAEGMLERPASVQVTPQNTPTDLVDQVIHPVDLGRKRELLTHLVRTRAIDQALVFMRTKHGANKLAELLSRDGIATAAIHGNKSQPQRLRALNDFKAGRVTLLVATEVAARGLDIEALPHVVNYELPVVPGDYVHRIGRTGRAGLTGSAVSLVSPEESGFLRDVERLLGTPITRRIVAGFEPDPNARVEPLARGLMRGGNRGGTRGGARDGSRGARPRPVMPHAGVGAGGSGERPRGDGFGRPTRIGSWGGDRPRRGRRQFGRGAVGR
ncbi:MAG: ATP-dependent RNA helicase RhlE [Chloroflexi bacterium]|nr:MAG: ATP-dependent RNA helicase RhlE [Chloroflexota bacterium]